MNVETQCNCKAVRSIPYRLVVLWKSSIYRIKSFQYANLPAFADAAAGQLARANDLIHCVPADVEHVELLRHGQHQRQVIITGAAVVSYAAHLLPIGT